MSDTNDIRPFIPTRDDSDLGSGISISATEKARRWFQEKRDAEHAKANLVAELVLREDFHTARQVAQRDFLPAQKALWAAWENYKAHYESDVDRALESDRDYGPLGGGE